jgi:hypothetical protein
MKMNYLLKLALASSLLAPSLALAQTGDPEVSRRIESAADTAPSPNRVSVAYRMGLNLTASFKGLGGFQAQSDPGPATGTKQPHTYDDGYFLPDSRLGNIDHYTWNWGFNSPSQVQPGAGTPYGSLLLHSSSAPATAESSVDGPQHGLEIAFDRQLGHLGRARWGIEAAFNFTDVAISDDSPLAGTSLYLTDTYDLEGLNPFTSGNTPYHGTFYGPGPLPVDSPASRQIQQIQGGSTITGRRTLDASLYGLRLGPYLELPLSKRFAVSLSGGLALVYVDSDFQYSETVALNGVGWAQSRAGGSSRGELLVGGQVAGTISYAFSRSLSTFASAQFQDVGRFTQSVGGKTAELDLQAGVFVLLGLSCSF